MKKLFNSLFPGPGSEDDALSYDLFNYFRDELIFKGEHYQEAYQKNSPFPHIAIDDFLPDHVAQRILDRFPGADFKGYEQPDNEYQTNKLGRIQASQFKGVDEWLRNTVHHFNSVPFINFLQLLTGINRLIPDPYFSGGAFHQILTGGKLDIHADFNVDLDRMLRRRINVLVYFNQDWKPEYGGDLELWDSEMTACEQKISPHFNRAVIFNTTSDSYHGHPHPLTCPPSVTRKSLAFYYYQADEKVFTENYIHNTLWQKT